MWVMSGTKWQQRGGGARAWREAGWSCHQQEVGLCQELYLKKNKTKKKSQALLLPSPVLPRKPDLGNTWLCIL